MNRLAPFLLRLLLLCAGFVGPIALRTGAQQSGDSVTRADLQGVVRQLEACNSLADIQLTLRACAAVVTNRASDTILARELQRDDLTSQQTVLLNLARDTCRDAREAGIELAAETLGIRVVIRGLLNAQTPEAAKAWLVRWKDVTGNELRDAAFKRLATGPDLNELQRNFLAEFAAALREAKDSPDTAVARLQKLAQGENNVPGDSTSGETAASTGNATGGGDALAGHWRCTTTGVITTDHHTVLKADGTFRSWSHSFNSFSGNESTTESGTGRWKVQGGTLILTGLDGQSLEIPFKRSGDTLLLPNESSRRLWERVR